MSAMGKDKTKQDQFKLRRQGERPVIRKIQDLKPYEDKKGPNK